MARLPHIALAVEGPAFTTVTGRTVEAVPDRLYLVDSTGVIARVLDPAGDDAAKARHAAEIAGWYTKLEPGQYLLPGLVDTHIHAPQWAQTGTGLDEPLEVWLDKYTFPLEARFSDPVWAEAVYSDLVATLLRLGTTTAVYYGTVDTEATLTLAALAAKAGQRAFVGKVVADDPGANPRWYRDSSTRAALAETERFLGGIGQLAAKAPQGLYGVVTPRFIPSCTLEGLKGLGQIAQQTGAFVQTHVSEGDWEHHFSLERYGVSGTVVLEQAGLLGERTILGHVVHASDDDLRRLYAHDAVISHCPHSNAYFASAVAPVRRMLDEFKLRVGLGSDISGGFSPSLWQTIRQAVISSRMLQAGVDAARAPARRGRPGSALTVDEAFYLATAGGAEALGLKAGRLLEGYLFDAQVIDTTSATGNRLPLFDEAADAGSHGVFEKIAYLTTAANVRQVWVHGAQAVPPPGGANH
ncbi:MAG: amidohydrolase family protein [Bifidobacteriaceae bacterium]|jgi:guanine deaminase|nr:amidohydrolase family protein [Bifidobacteriaceae bacterium]